jgi:Tol biopolymer transport system component
MDNSSQPKVLMRKENVDFGAIRWSADGNYIYYLSSNLWKVAVEDGTTQSLTTGMDILVYRFLPGQPWIYLTDIWPYETPSNDSPKYYSIWLLNSEDGTLRRLTTQEEDWVPYTHSPNGASLLVTRNGVDPHLFSLVDGSLTSVEERIGPGNIYIISGNRIIY